MPKQWCSRTRKYGTAMTIKLTKLLSKICKNYHTCILHIDIVAQLGASPCPFFDIIVNHVMKIFPTLQEVKL